MWRKRLLALQDNLALAVFVGGLAAAAIVLYSRLRPLDISGWALAALVFSAVAGVFIARWYMTRASVTAAAFDIDRALGLEDRVATARSIISRGGPDKAVEMALIDDAAERVSNERAASIVPYRMPRRYAICFAGVVALAAASMVPERMLPGGEAVAAAREDIQAAGEQLEQAAAEVEQIAPAQTPTASLAKEQAELGSALRRSKDTRAEVLKKLGALEQRIRERHGELQETRADEIVSLAEKRFQSAVAQTPRPQPKKASAEEEKAASTPESDQGDQPGAAAATDAKDAKNAQAGKPQPQTTARKPDDKSAAKPAESVARAQGQQPQTANQNQVAQNPRAQNPGAQNQGARGSANSNSARAATGQTDRQTTGSPESTGKPEPQAAGQEPAVQNPQGGQDQPPAQGGEPSSPSQEPSQLPSQLPSVAPELAAKALPALSDQLLQKASELRAGQLKAEDIARLAQSAQALARDLAPLAQSKEFREAVEQLARQVNPQQLEEVARQLLSQEKVRKELEAAAQLLMQNRQAREIVAGLERQFGDRPGDGREPREGAGPGQNQPGGENSQIGSKQSGPGRSNSGGEGRGRGGRAGQPQNASGDIVGRGREAKVSGKLERKPGGEYLYLEAKPGVGAARVPYSSAYPQYRRAAERSVERSKVPPHLRSVVRNYFDAINPDAKKQ